MSDFKRAWYENTKENQETLFKFGYSWGTRDRAVKYLDYKFLYTNKDGFLTCGNQKPDYTTQKGTQIKPPLTTERIQDALNVLKEMYEVDATISLIGVSYGKPRLKSGKRLVGMSESERFHPQKWMDTYLPTKSKEQLELEEVVANLQKSLDEANAKLKEM